MGFFHVWYLIWNSLKKSRPTYHTIIFYLILYSAVMVKNSKMLIFFHQPWRGISASIPNFCHFSWIDRILLIDFRFCSLILPYWLSWKHWKCLYSPINCFYCTFCQNLKNYDKACFAVEIANSNKTKFQVAVMKKWHFSCTLHENCISEAQKLSFLTFLPKICSAKISLFK